MHVNECTSPLLVIKFYMWRLLERSDMKHLKKDFHTFFHKLKFYFLFCYNLVPHLLILTTEVCERTT